MTSFDPSSTVIVISSHVVRGTVGNRAAAFALEVLGHPVWAVPSLVLPWHPGHTQKAGPGRRIVPSPEDFDALIDDLSAAPWLPEVGGILTGYLGNAEQAVSIAKLVRAAKAENPNLIYALDPVIGDDAPGGGRLYVPEIQADAIRSELLPLADLITPNAFEMNVLAQSQSFHDVEALKSAARAMAPRAVLITSMPGSTESEISNWLLGAGQDLCATTPRLPKVPNGAGDLTAALMLSALLKGQSGENALRQATASVFDVLTHAEKAGSDELPLEQCLQNLRAPQSRVKIEALIQR